MQETVIQVRNLSKLYRLGTGVAAGLSFREMLGNQVAGSLAKLTGRATHPVQPADFWALQDISFDVRQGEVMGLIGRNGAGKSTLLKILSRITDPTRGFAAVRGRVGSLLEVGTGFHPELTGRENIYLNGAVLGMTHREIKRKFDQIVAFAEVERFLDTPVKRYSSGMYVRLAFAVAAHLEPEVLLVDEVLAVGDAAFQKKCLGKMGDVAKEGRTVLFVSHNMTAVSSLCDRVVWLSQGQVAQVGPASEIVRAYLKPLEQSSSGDLREHAHRAPGLTPMLTTLTIEPGDAGVCHGQPLRFRMGYDLPHPVAVPQFCITVHSLDGVKVFTLISSYQQHNLPHSLSGKGQVTAQVEALPLMPGDYTVTVTLWQPGQKLDEVESACPLSVSWAGQRQPGQFQWTQDFGTVYVDARWQLDQSSQASTRYEQAA